MMSTTDPGPRAAGNEVTESSQALATRHLLAIEVPAELAHAAAIGLLVWLGVRELPSTNVLIWGSGVVGVQIGRLVLRWSLAHRKVAAATAMRWLRGSVLLLGLAWGSGVLPLWAHLPFHLFAISVLGYCLIIMLTIFAFGVDTASFYLFAAPLLLPTALAVVARGVDDTDRVLAATVALFTAATMAFYQRAHRALLDLLTMSDRARSSEQRFRQLTENIPEVFFVSAADLSRLLYISPAYERMWGQPLDRLYQNPRAILEPVHPDDLGRFAAAIERVQQGHTAEVQFRLVLGDGTVRTILNRVVPVRDADGAVYRIAGVARDVTDEAAAREAERRAHEEGQRMAAAKMAFLANMSHEIRTPMSGILGMAELLGDTPLTPEQQSSLDVITGSAEALLAILNDILDLSKIDAGEVSLETVPFNLPGLVHSTTRLVGVRAFERGLELVCDCESDVPQRVRGDPGRLRQVLTNLLGNAVKFTQQGEVVLRVRVAHREAAQSVIEFAVRDTGIGIAAEQRERIFAPFGQADSSTTRKYGGTGLGLSISRRLVRLMGGDLTLQSEVGSGSTFSFQVAFPVEQEVPDAAPARRPAGLQGVRTLVVDDNPTNRHVLGELFRYAGADIDEAESVEHALTALRRAHQDAHPYQLLVSDVNMPTRDGFDLAQAVQDDPTLAGLRIMLLTSAGQPGDGNRCRELGVAAYLHKPVSRVELLESAVAAIAGATAPADRVSLVTRHAIEEARQGLHILLAEDNPVNQQVATAMLHKRGHRVDIAENGRRAVDAVREGSYDVVLMDIQMPELDGLDATREIRRLLGDRRLPIIALTADVLPGERERCLAAGMDDYVAKPFKAFELFAAVEGWATPAPAAPAPPSAPVDLDAFRATMREADAEDAVDTILATFVTALPGYVDTLADVVAAKDAPGIQRAAHAFKSAAGSIGAHGLAAALQDVEHAARAGDVAAACTESEHARDEAKAVLNYLRGATDGDAIHA